MSPPPELFVSTGKELIHEPQYPIVKALRDRLAAKLWQQINRRRKAERKGGYVEEMSAPRKIKVNDITYGFCADFAQEFYFHSTVLDEILKQAERKFESDHDESVLRHIIREAREK